jgi:hypothetical protein
MKGFGLRSSPAAGPVRPRGSPAESSLGSRCAG